MVAASPSITEVRQWLANIPDPEIPVLSIVDLGIVREVAWLDEELLITITPTYSGCPAMEVIASEIRATVESHGVSRLRLVTKLAPAWTTDWLSDVAKERLREYGVAPPAPLIAIDPRVACPRCGSFETQLISRFGSTACKALYKCRSCLEPFDVFKRH